MYTVSILPRHVRPGSLPLRPRYRWLDREHRTFDLHGEALAKTLKALPCKGEPLSTRKEAFRPMRNPFLCFLLSLAVFLWPSPGWLAAGDLPARTPLLTRAEAVDRAVRQHPQVEAAARRQDASAERITQARSGLLPFQTGQ